MSAVEKPRVPILYSPHFNVKFYGLEKLHPFDSCKYEKIAASMEPNWTLYDVDRCTTEEELAVVHDERYLRSLKNSFTVAQICELLPLAICPHFLVDRHVLKAMRWQVRGTVLAGELAMQHGWAINLGGGMHHAAPDSGSGWCVYADIFLAIKNLQKKADRPVHKVMIVDLDVHQGNGLARSKASIAGSSLQVFLIDFYNPSIFPRDGTAKASIDLSWPVKRGTQDEEYLAALETTLAEAFESFRPDAVFYNAGTDVLIGDPLGGGVKLSVDGVVQRDEVVMRSCVDRSIPVAMVLSGGYAENSASTVSQSIANLCENVLPQVSTLDA